MELKDSVMRNIDIEELKDIVKKTCYLARKEAEIYRKAIIYTDKEGRTKY